MEKKYYLSDLGLEVTLGKFAEQADGAVWIQKGGTVVLATVVSARSKEFPGFLPMSVDYRENFSAAGKIPGGYYKREGKFSDKEVLVSRLIDRSLRPLFPVNFFDQLQIIATVYSVDKENAPYTLALIAASLALSISHIPFLGPIGAAEVVRVEGEWIVNPTYAQSVASDVKITVAGTFEGVCMVEGTSNQISEDEFIDALFLGHEAIKKQVMWQKEIQSERGVAKQAIAEELNWPLWRERAEKYLTPEAISKVFIADKVERGQAISLLKDSFLDSFKTEMQELSLSKTFVEYVFDEVFEVVLTEESYKHNKRIDNRDFATVRAISTEVGLLPFNHGSALFKRGKTQALVSVTLGGGQDEQRIEDIMSEPSESSFMLHYNFPPFSVGEVRGMRAPGRREIGHGYLAASAIKQVLPHKLVFPYTIRIVADMLGSDGSTSMATICGSTMALMNAGVPITDMVSGIAMGLLMNKAGEFRILSDIAGIEDAFGLMDFKVAGTEKGITAIQMDIKHKTGLPREIFERSLAQAKIGRVHILTEMRKVMTGPNAKLSDLVPQVVAFVVPTDKIGAIIGTGGKVIRDIIDKTGTAIDIENDGTVKIFGHPGPKLDQAIGWVKTLGGQIDRGMVYHGKIKKVAEFGIFVEVAPGVDGLVHVSNMPRDRSANFMTTMKPEELVTVEVVDYEASTGRIRLKLIE
ncbi:polyribonucleotide nucleotidyltransferase [Candidatus Dependentiae bacterium]|nr:polyribonucleotide nucleotidyltransferase [Candidatus Dependentiae bacterium]